MSRAGEIGVGLFVAGFGLFLILLGVPEGVVRPKSVRNIVLAPDFWPFVLAWVLLAGGLGLALRAALGRGVAEGPPDEAPSARAAARLAGFAAILVAFALLIDVLGMVFAAIAASLAMLAIIRPRRPVAAVLVALILPFGVYFFFSEVAGVPIPQGDFVRLP